MKNNQFSRRDLLCSLLAPLLLTNNRISFAADKINLPNGVYPSKQIKLVVPLPPGGGADLVGRLVADKLSSQLGASFVVDNQAGGGTVIGTNIVARSPADGYTMLLGTATSHAINYSLIKNLPYNPIKNFDPISLIAILPIVLVIHPSIPATNLSELINYIKQSKSSFNFGSTGNGSSNHLAGEMLKMLANIEMTHIPYKGASPALIDLLSGRIQMMFSTIPPILQYIKTKKLNPILVASSQRSNILPNLPTASEAGLPGVDASSWNGLFVPSGTPKEIISLLNKEIKVVLEKPDVLNKFYESGIDPFYKGPEDFIKFISEEAERYSKVIDMAKINI